MATERGLDLAKRLWSWCPHSQGQRDWMLCNAKVKTAACGRRWGKSESQGVDIVLYALENPNSTQFIVAPTDDQTKIIMQQVSRFLHAVPALSTEIREIRSPYHSIVLLDAKGLARGTSLAGRTAGVDGKGLRGHKAHRVNADEAAYIPDAIMDNVISPLLADYNGDLVKMSTPAGRNHFHRDYIRGIDPLQTRYASFQFPTSTNPFIPQEYLDNEKATKPERTWQQEYLAEFLEDAGGVFRNVMAAVDKTRSANEPARAGVRYRLGCDLARVEDFTVLSICEVATGRQVYHERFNQISWERQIAAIESACNAYNRAEIVLDSTGIGDPIFEALRKRGLPVTPFTFTNSSKESLIDNLAMEIEQGVVSLLSVDVQTNELLSYQYELTPSRNVRMNAPSGMHDDCVIALALSRFKTKLFAPGGSGRY